MTPDPSSGTLVLPRGLILLASLWLVVSWVLTMGFQAPVEASSASYTPGVRIMVVCMALGMVVGWPLLRLSEPTTAFPIRRVLLDLVVLLALFQVVLWPLRLVTTWTPARTAAIDATLAGWTALAGAMVAAAVGSSRAGPRSLAMAVCVAMCLAGPVSGWLGIWLGVAPGRHTGLGPLMEVHALSAGGGGPPAPEQWRWIALLAAAVAAGWCVLLVATRRRLRRSRTMEGPARAANTD